MRKILLLAAFLLTAVAIGLGAGLWLFDDEGGGSAASIGGPFHLIGHDGRGYRDTDFKGNPFLVFFGYTHCPDICPTTLFEASEMLEALGDDAKRTRALFISVDPSRDTPTVMADYISAFNPRILGLTGDEASIAAAMKAYRVYAKKAPQPDGDYSMDHTAIVYLMDKTGRFVAPFNLKRAPAEAAADLRRYF